MFFGGWPRRKLGHSFVHCDRGILISQKGRVSEVRWWSSRKRAGAVVSASVSFSSRVVIVAADVDCPM